MENYEKPPPPDPESGAPLEMTSADDPLDPDRTGKPDEEPDDSGYPMI